MIYLKVDGQRASELLVDYGIDLFTNTIYLTGDINDEMYENVTRGFSHLDPTEARTVVLKTNGGDLNTSFAIYDFLKKEGCENIIAMGDCQSGGMLIMQAAKKRISYSNTELMIHYGDGVVSLAGAELYRRQLQKMEDIFRERSGQDFIEMRALLRNDTYLTPREAKDKGLIDVVLS